MKKIDAKGWGKLNMWRHQGGDLAVRPGLRRLFTPGAGQTIINGFTVRNNYIDEVTHYVTTTHATNGVHLLLLDENYDTFQDFKWASDGGTTVRAVTFASVEGQLLINSPDLPPIFGMVGSGVEFAVKVSSDNTTTSALDIPSGITTSFCNRGVTAQGRSLFFTDPVAADGGDMRTVVGFNQNQRPGIIYGLHEGAGGMLVAVTSEGTYGLDADAVAVQIVGSNGTSWRLLSHVSAHSFNSSCVHRGRVYVLTANGWAAADIETTQETQIGDETMPRLHGPSLNLPDFRRCSIFSADAGPVIAAPRIGVLHCSDIASGIASFWRDQTDYPGDLRGIMRGHDGGELWAMPDGIYIVNGDFDGDIALSGADAEAAVKGVLFGIDKGTPAQSRRVRHVHVSAATDGDELMYAAVRGYGKSATPDADANGLTVATDSWGASTLTWWTSTPMASVRFDFGSDVAVTDDVSIEVAATGCLTRISTDIDVEYTESAQTRPSKSA